jgi:uncharacterized protein DUF29
MDDRPDTVDAPRAAADAVAEAPTTYERDFYLWCFEQAELLRLRRFSQADLPNIIEELESMGRSDRRALSSSYRLVIAHLLKWQYQPQLRGSSWEVTLLRERAHIKEMEEQSGSLRADARRIVEDVYLDAKREASTETRLPRSSFPAECPYSPDQLRNPDWFPA